MVRGVGNIGLAICRVLAGRAEIRVVGAMGGTWGVSAPTGRAMCCNGAFAGLFGDEDGEGCCPSIFSGAGEGVSVVKGVPPGPAGRELSRERHLPGWRKPAVCIQAPLPAIMAPMMEQAVCQPADGITRVEIP